MRLRSAANVINHHHRTSGVSTMTSEPTIICSGTAVVLHWAASLDEVAASELSASAVLLWLLDRSFDRSAFGALLAELLDDGPSELMLTAPDPDELVMAMFALITEQGLNPSAPIQVLSGLDVASTVDEFLERVKDGSRPDADSALARATIVLVGPSTYASDIAAIVRSRAN